MDPERARQRLREERERIERELDAIGGPERTDEPEDSADQATELDQNERDEAIRDDLKRILAAIDRAEARIEEGTFGRSVVSGDPIPAERLEALPWAERTVEEESRTR
jgi:DnaK suppressor protein